MRLIPILLMAAAAQTSDPAPRFDVSDVHPTPSSTTASPRNNFMRGPFLGGGRYELRNASMLDLIETAYDFPPDKILGGPAWLDSDRFDISAKTAPATTPETMNAMLRTLLAERFSLVVRKDTKPLPAYALTLGKRPQLKPSDGSGESGCHPQAASSQPGQGGMIIANGRTGIPIGSDGTIQYACRNIAMPAFAQAMSEMIGVGNSLGSNPVRDETGLKGTFDFDIRISFTARGAIVGNTDNAERITIFSAVEKLGLKLEQKQYPIPVIVVESVNRTPTPNAPGVSTKLPALPTEFEVAEIKPTSPDARGGRYQIQPGGRVSIQGMTLQFLVQDSWDLPQDRIFGAPKSFGTDRWDIVAKARTFGPSPDTGAAERYDSVDRETVSLMLRALITDRFKFAFHWEDRPVAVFTLIAVKPKMKKADPVNRTGFFNGPGPDGKDPRVGNPAASRLVTCQNMTMAQFAQNLPNIAGGYIKGGDVLDATGLDGAYDFTLNFSAAGMVGRPGRGGRGGDTAAPGEASDPSGAISLQEALEKQLGLKLETTKRPAKVMVIDHVEAKPTEN